MWPDKLTVFGRPARSFEKSLDRRCYASAVKVGLQFKRRFWEEDEVIYGGTSYTDLPIRQIAYPNTGYNRSGRGVLAYIIEGSNSYEFTSMPPAQRVARAVALGSRIHPQYEDEFENGVAVAWHRVPFTLGCAGYWTEKARALRLAAAVVGDFENFVGEVFRLILARASIQLAKFLIASEPAEYRDSGRHCGIGTDGPQAFTVDEPKLHGCARQLRGGFLYYRIGEPSFFIAEID